jgi:hypothetical protein
MRWTAKVSQKHVLGMLIRSHQKNDREEKFMELFGALVAGEQRMWWYRVLKSYCADYKDGAIIGYDEPVGDCDLQGFDEENWSFFKKADIKDLGRAPMVVSAVQRLTGLEHDA